MLAHELKAPLAAVEGYLHIIHDRSAGDDPKAYEHMLDRSLVRTAAMRKLIGDLLDLTRIESGQKKRDMANVDLREVAKASIEMVSVEALRRNIAIKLQADSPVELQADRGEMEIICNNLISNAVKYNRDGGSVTVTLTAQTDKAQLSVADTGIGMTDDEAGRLFGDFVRIKNEKTRNIVGSGLGLSIVKKLASLYGGDVSVQSTPDVGSTFTVILPLPAAPSTGSGQASST